MNTNLLKKKKYEHQFDFWAELTLSDHLKKIALETSSIATQPPVLMKMPLTKVLEHIIRN
jgi:hypothetical protein